MSIPRRNRPAPAPLWVRGHDCHGRADAVRAAMLFVPHAALIDLTLPGLDGFDVAMQLRALTATNDCRLIAMTGWTADEYVDRARAAGFDEHLVKPISADALLHALAAIPATPPSASPRPSGTTAESRGPHRGARH